MQHFKVYASPRHISRVRIGKALAAIREEKHISQNKLAMGTGLNRGYLHRLENDQISPTLDTLERVCSYLAIQVSELLARAEESPNQ